MVKGMGTEKRGKLGVSQFTYHVLILNAVYNALIYNPGKLR